MKISILIPAHNEERSIRATIDSCLMQTRTPDQILVVNDGSTDRTAEILATFGDKIQVVTIPQATGNKSFAQQEGLKHITGDIFIATDGDTMLESRFVEMIEPHFEKKEVSAVAGYVKSIKNNWLTACREIDYAIGQDLHKRAQSNIGFLFVIPGCAGAFRTEKFKEIIKFDHDTLTEDLDFTYKFHTEYCSIVFERRAIVYTQDPFTLYGYINQIRRWYSGGWQNLLKHLPRMKSRPMPAFELSLIYFEGIIFSFLIFILPIFRPRFFLYYIGVYFIFILAISSYASLERQRVDLVFYSPFYILLIFLNAWIFLEQLTNEVILRKRKVVWFKPERTGEIIS